MESIITDSSNRIRDNYGSDIGIFIKDSFNSDYTIRNNHICIVSHISDKCGFCTIIIYKFIFNKSIHIPCSPWATGGCAMVNNMFYVSKSPKAYSGNRIGYSNSR